MGSEELHYDPPYIHFRNYVCTHASIHVSTIPYISTYLHTLIENTFRKNKLKKNVAKILF